MIENDRSGGRHARHQRQITVVDADHDVVGHDVLNRLRRLTPLSYGALEDPLRKGVHGEGRLVAFLDAAHVGFAGIGIYFKLLEVLGDEKQGWRLEARGHSLPTGHAAGYHSAVDWRDDVGVVEIELGTFHQRLVEFDGRLVLVDRISLVLGLLSRDRVLRGELLITRKIGAVFVKHCLIAKQLAFILVEYCLIGARIDLGANLTRTHLRVVVAIKVLNDAGVVGSDNDCKHRIDGSCGGRGASNSAVRGPHRDVLHGPASVHVPPNRADGCGNNNQTDRRPATADIDPAPPGLCSYR